MIRLLYFASLREAVGTGEETTELQEPLTITALRTQLAARGGCWADAFAPEKQLLAAINQTLVAPDARIHRGDEVAFFPPVTGG